MFKIEKPSKFLLKLFLVTTALLIPQLSFGQQIFFKNLDKLELRSKDGLFVLQIERSTPSFNLPENWSWGSDGKNPDRSITRLRLLFKGENVYVPLSSFIDLGDPEKLEAIPKGKNFTIRIYGGQSSTSYVAVLLFDRKNIKQRIVCSKEFPDDSCEKTNYSYPKEK